MPVASRSRPREKPDRQRLTQAIGSEVVLFQEASTAFDDLAAEILALTRRDLPCLTLLLFGGPARIETLVHALNMQPNEVGAIVERLELAGYARRQPADHQRIELTGHAREWVERIWGPLRDEGHRLMSGLTTGQLRLVEEFMRRARDIQERRAVSLRQWLAVPASPARRPHLRGGLSPAGLQRVQLFVEANLERPLRLRDLAQRAGLSTFHFARAFRTSAGMTPHAFIETQRVERARRLVAETRDSLAEIAVKTGFGSQSRFTTIFRRRTGFTPAQFRRGQH